MEAPLDRCPPSARAPHARECHPSATAAPSPDVARRNAPVDLPSAFGIPSGSTKTPIERILHSRPGNILQTTATAPLAPSSHAPRAQCRRARTAPRPRSHPVTASAEKNNHASLSGRRSATRLDLDPPAADLSLWSLITADSDAQARPRSQCALGCAGTLPRAPLFPIFNQTLSGFAACLHYAIDRPRSPTSRSVCRSGPSLN